MLPKKSSSADELDAKVILGVLAQLQEGDFTARMPLDWIGVAGKVADRFNELIVSNEAFRIELHRVSQVVGRDGHLSQRFALGESAQESNF